MSENVATVLWTREGQTFTDNRYSRRHLWQFDGGAQVLASSAPSSVPLPYSDPSAVDPEEAVVAATSSCHMLFFLSLAAKSGFSVERYEDAAVGTLAKDERGRISLTEIVLRPQINWNGREPDADALADLHHRAHEACYIANSLRATVRVEA
jgi:organic hydroperoxide reductase OsmC/OhrA